jgi:hypothetical protein
LTKRRSWPTLALTATREIAVTEEPTAPETGDALDDDEPEVQGFMEMPKIASMGSILPPIKPSKPPSGPAGPGTTIGGDTVQTPGGSGTPGPVTFPNPA